MRPVGSRQPKRNCTSPCAGIAFAKEARAADGSGGKPNQPAQGFGSPKRYGTVGRKAPLLAGTTASTHEDAYVDSGTSPPKSERLPKGYVHWATDIHIEPMAYGQWFNDWLAQGSQQNLDIDVILPPRIAGTLPELHPALWKYRIHVQIGAAKYGTLSIRAEAAKGLVSKQVPWGLLVVRKRSKVNPLAKGEARARRQ